MDIGLIRACLLRQAAFETLLAQILSQSLPHVFHLSANTLLSLIGLQTISDIALDMGG